MLAHRVIPQLLVDKNKLIKGQGFDAWRSVGVPQQAVRIHQMRQVDEIMLVDITATPENRGPDLGLIEELAKECFSPLTVGGGVKTVEDIRELLRHGADKVCIGTAAFEDPMMVMEAVDRFGSSTIVASIDVKWNRGNPLVYTRCGTRKTIVRAHRAAIGFEKMGVGEILLTNIDREGTMGGYDLKLIGDVSGDCGIPIIAAGGCSGYQDMADAIWAGADAVAVGALFQFSDHTPRGAAEYLSGKGLEARCL